MQFVSSVLWLFNGHSDAMAQLHLTSRASGLSRLSQTQQPCCAVLPGRACQSSRQTPFISQAQASSSRAGAAAVQVLQSSKRQRRSVLVQVGVTSVGFKIDMI